ncbi:MAG TPA: hypothetical protein PK867_01615 [Pirellulales bacterium]|nr:hypothetical protein [Pirellulales bacterium]
MVNSFAQIGYVPAAAGQRCPGGDAPGHRLAATLLKGASRYLAKLCPSHRFSSRQNVSFSAA